MKCCLNGSQSKEYLQKADQIKISYKNRKDIIDLIETCGQADIIVDISNEIEDVDWGYLENMDKAHYGKNEHRVIVALGKLGKLNAEASVHNLRWYYRYPISTFMEADSLYELGAYSIILAPPLTHMLDDVKYLHFPEVRMIANIAYHAYIPRQNGIIGGYMRPEDVEAYEEYVDVIEFEDCDKKKEQALYRIYMEDHAWPGDLQTIITNLNYPGVNRMIPSNFAVKRMNCGQGCLSTAACHICKRYLDLANPELLKDYKS